EVLRRAAGIEDVAGLPLIKAHREDTDEFLRRRLVVSIPPSTQLITVSMTHADPGEGAKIVNAVVASYMDAAGKRTADASSKQIQDAKRLKGEYKVQVEELHDRLKAGHEKSQTSEMAVKERAAEGALEQYRQSVQRLGQVHLDRIEAEVRLKVLREWRD